MLNIFKKSLVNSHLLYLSIGIIYYLISFSMISFSSTASIFFAVGGLFCLAIFLLFRKVSVGHNWVWNLVAIAAILALALISIVILAHAHGGANEYLYLLLVWPIVVFLLSTTLQYRNPKLFDGLWTPDELNIKQWSFVLMASLIFIVVALALLATKHEAAGEYTAFAYVGFFVIFIVYEFYDDKRWIH